MIRQILAITLKQSVVCSTGRSLFWKDNETNNWPEGTNQLNYLKLSKALLSIWAVLVTRHWNTFKIWKFKFSINILSTSLCLFCKCILCCWIVVRIALHASLGFLIVHFLACHSQSSQQTKCIKMATTIFSSSHLLSLLPSEPGSSHRMLLTVQL